MGKCGWELTGAIVCAAFCGMSARIQGRNLRYRSTVDETPDTPGARGEGGALGARLGLAGFGRVAQAWLGRSAARGAGRLVPGGERRQAKVAQNAMESSP